MKELCLCLLLPIISSVKIELASQAKIAKENAIYEVAIDINTLVTNNTFTCLKFLGFSTVFIQVYDPVGGGSVDPNAIINIKAASQAGLGIEVFATPNRLSSKSAVTQFAELFSYLGNNRITVFRVWLKVTSPINWDHNRTSNANFIEQFIMCAKLYGISVGIYSNWYDWQQITDDWVHQYHLSLWYWNVLGTGDYTGTYPDFSDFRQFPGFKVPSVKQFAEAISVCDVIVNQNVYSVQQKTSSVKGNRKLKDNVPKEEKKEIVVGALQLPEN